MGVQELWKKEQLALLRRKALLRRFLEAPRGVCVADQRLEVAGQLTLRTLVSMQTNNAILRKWHSLLVTQKTISVLQAIAKSVLPRRTETARGQTVFTVVMTSVIAAASSLSLWPVLQ